MHDLSLYLQLHYHFEVILMLPMKQMKICIGLNSLFSYNQNLGYGIFSFIALVPEYKFCRSLGYSFLCVKMFEKNEDKVKKDRSWSIFKKNHFLKLKKLTQNKFLPIDPNYFLRRLVLTTRSQW